MKILTMRRSTSLIMTSLVIGCGGVDQPTLCPASGLVQVGGKPAAGVRVRLHALGGSDTSTPHAITGADGVFVLESSGRPGAPSGRYAVTLTWPPPPGFGPPGRAASDRFAGRYAARDRAFIEVMIQPGSNDVGVLDVPESSRSTTPVTLRPGNRP